MDTINLCINEKICTLGKQKKNNNIDSLLPSKDEDLSENKEDNKNFSVIDSTLFSREIFSKKNKNKNLQICSSSLIFSSENTKENTELFPINIDTKQKFIIDSSLFYGDNIEGNIYNSNNKNLSLFSFKQDYSENKDNNWIESVNSSLFSGMNVEENKDNNWSECVNSSLFSGTQCLKENTDINQNISIDSSLYSKENINIFLKHNENNDKKSYCINCGKNGHVSKKCLCPIISIGIICVKINIDDLDLNTLIIYSKKLQNNYLFSSDEIKKLKSLKKKIDIFNKNINNNIEYLLIRRKNSLNYVEFIRGKYDLYNLDYLIKSFNFITIDEKNMIQNYYFEYLWKDLWSDNINYNNIEFKESCEKFNLLKKGFFIKKNEINIFISINILIKNSIYNFTEPEWGYPKGRRNMKEKNIDCAKREFEEETLIRNDNINIVNITPLEETYIASNGLKYKHIYYVSQIKDKNIKLKVDTENIYQKIEVGDIKWFKFHDGIKILREYNIEKKNVLLNLHYNIKYMVDNLINCIENNFN